MKSAITKARVGALLACAMLFCVLLSALMLGTAAHPINCPAIGCDETWNYENGFCLHCGAYEEPVLNPGESEEASDDYSEITNAGNLYWLADYINRTPASTGVNAVLMNNITVNKGVLNADGTLSDAEKKPWTPIGKTLACVGLTFDGNGYVISGLYTVCETPEPPVLEEGEEGEGEGASEVAECLPAGFIGYASNVTVKNLGICDSYFESDTVAGGIIAKADGACTVEYTFFQGVVSAPSCGGIVGEATSGEKGNEIRVCYTTAAAVVSTVGELDVVEDCFYLSFGETDELEGTTYLSDVQFTSGELRDALSTEQTPWYHSCVRGLPMLHYDHVYNNPCDVECQKKNDCVNKADGLREGEPHVFDNACDTTCNVCLRIRQVGEHEYSNSCDTDCDHCGHPREAGEHLYSNACDATCNNCPYTRQVPAHVYDGDCDPDCNTCGARRESVGAHTFDNSCDTVCNGCGAFREGGHEYSFVCDEYCDVCNGKREVEHPFGDYVITREATDFEAGEKKKTCTVCGLVVTEEIPPISKIPFGALVAIVLGGSALLVFGTYAVVVLIRKKKKAKA